MQFELIQQVKNKHDYSEYLGLCKDNNVNPVSFVHYALAVEPPSPVVITTQALKSCNTCGGGKVL